MRRNLVKCKHSLGDNMDDMWTFVKLISSEKTIFECHMGIETASFWSSTKFTNLWSIRRKLASLGAGKTYGLPTHESRYIITFWNEMNMTRNEHEELVDVTSDTWTLVKLNSSQKRLLSWKRELNLQPSDGITVVLPKTRFEAKIKLMHFLCGSHDMLIMLSIKLRDIWNNIDTLKLKIWVNY